MEWFSLDLACDGVFGLVLLQYTVRCTTGKLSCYAIKTDHEQIDTCYMAQ